MKQSPFFPQSLQRAARSERNQIIVLAVALGVVTAICVWIFRQAIALFHTIFFGFIVDQALSPIIGVFAIVVSLALAGFIVGWIMQRFIGTERHAGVGGVIESVAVAGGKLRYKRMPFKALASAISNGAGASVGPEDPSVQIGGNLGSWLGQLARQSEDHVAILVAAGGAAAIAAAFKAPFAGVFFAVEVILNGKMEGRSLMVVVLSAVMSSAVTQAIAPGFNMGPFSFSLSGALEILAFAPLGLLIAIVGVVFMRSLRLQHRLWSHVNLSRPMKTALAGALVGLVGIFLPAVLGPGHEVVDHVLTGELHFTVVAMLVLVVAKIIVTGISHDGGFVGGLFAPALFIGTMLGSAYGQVFAMLPGISATADPRAYGIAGMAAMIAAVVRAPITAILLVFELTNDFLLIVPLMLVTVVAVLVAERFEPFGVYLLGLRSKGVFLPEGREVDLMQSVLVEDVMQKPAPLISSTASLLELRDQLRASQSGALCLVDDAGSLSGIVTLTDLQRAYDLQAETVLTAGQIAVHKVITALPDEPVWKAIRQMNRHNIRQLAVVEPHSRKLIGLVGRREIIQAYQTATMRRMQDQHTAEKIRLNTLVGGRSYEYRVAENAAVSQKQIREILWPPDCIVAAVERDGRLLIPRGDTVLYKDDILTIVSAAEAQDELANLISMPADDSNPDSA